MCKVGSTSWNASKTTLKKYYRTLYVGSTGVYSATVNRGPSRKVLYKSSNTKLATVNKTTGKVTAKKAGKVRIYAIAHNGVKTYVTVTIKKKTSRYNGSVKPSAPTLNYVTFRPQDVTDTKAEARINFKTTKGLKYQILRKDSGDYKALATIKATSTAYTYLDKNAMENTSYTYTVREVETNGTYTVYGFYDEDGIQTLASVKNVKVDEQNLHAMIRWDNDARADYYTVHRKMFKSGAYKQLGQVDNGSSYDDVYINSVTTAEEKEYSCAKNFIDPSVNPFIYQIRAVKESRDSSGHTKYSYSYYNKDGFFELTQSAVIGYSNGTLYYSKVYRSDGYNIYKGHKGGDGKIQWTYVKSTTNQSGTKQSVKIDYDSSNPYFTVRAYSDRNGEKLEGEGDQGFYIDRELQEKYKDKKVLFLGNSITYGSPYKHPNTRHVFSYPYRVNQLLGVQYFNPSIPGSTYSLMDGAVDPKMGTPNPNQPGQDGRFRITRDVVDKMLAGEKTELSGYNDLGIEGEETYYPDDGSHVFAQYDIIIMAAGTNDYGDSDPITGDGDLTNMDQHNMTGAINYILSEIEAASQYRIDEEKPPELRKDPIKVVFLDFFYSDRLYDYSKRTNRFTTPNRIGKTLTDYQNQYDRLIEYYEDTYDPENGTKKGLLEIYHFKTMEYGFADQETCPYNTSDNLHMTRATYGRIGTVLAEYLVENVLESE